MLKKRIIASAWKIVEEEGMSKLNVRKVARLSKCSLGSIYNAFESFEALQIHINGNILLKLYKQFRVTMDRGIQQEMSLREVMRELGIEYIEFGKSNTFLWKALFENFSGKEVPLWYKTIARDGVDALCKKLAEGFDLPLHVVKEKVGFFWASIHGVSSIFLNRKTEMLAELISEERLIPYVEYCLDGLFNEEKVT